MTSRRFDIELLHNYEHARALYASCRKQALAQLPPIMSRVTVLVARRYRQHPIRGWIELPEAPYRAEGRLSAHQIPSPVHERRDEYCLVVEDGDGNEHLVHYLDVLSLERVVHSEPEFLHTKRKARKPLRHRPRSSKGAE